MTKNDLIRSLREEGILKSKQLEQALERVDRADFVRPEYRQDAYENYPLPIGAGQTISQPATVVFMLESLDVKPGQRILDVGSGSGWTTALLGDLAGSEGRVFGVERIPELVQFGQENLAKYKLENTTITKADIELGLQDKGPFDRILVSAEAHELPEDLVSQLKVGGVMVLPVNEAIQRVEKRSDGSLDIKTFPGYIFVPLIED